MFSRLWRIVRNLFWIVYDPRPDYCPFLARSQTQESPEAQVTVAVPSAQESQQLFGVPLARRGIQAVFLRIENRHSAPLRLSMLEIDPHYFTPLEAAGILHFWVLKRLSTLGIAALHFLPLLALLPVKLLAASLANGRMDDYFRHQAFPLRPIEPGESAEGFVYVTLDAGTKTVRVCLHATGGAGTEDGPGELSGFSTGPRAPTVDLTFVVPVEGISADYHSRDIEDLYSKADLIACDLPQLAQHLREMPPATTNGGGHRHGDPVNLIVLGDFETVLSAFAARWDECETVTLKTCWKTAKAFLLGVQYRYSPVSPLHLFGRSQDVALQRIRRSINERLHLRLWLTPLRFSDQSVWVGQISRDIGVRFTTQVWNLTTHRVDPDVDESRDYLVEDLLRAERVEAMGYVDGVGACSPEKPRRNLTGDPYFTDGKRAVIALSKTRTAPRFVGDARR
jgi:hypothetical protein